MDKKDFTIIYVDDEEQNLISFNKTTVTKINRNLKRKPCPFNYNRSKNAGNDGDSVFRKNYARVSRCHPNDFNRIQ